MEFEVYEALKKKRFIKVGFVSTHTHTHKSCFFVLKKITFIRVKNIIKYRYKSMDFYAHFK